MLAGQQVSAGLTIDAVRARRRRRHTRAAAALVLLLMLALVPVRRAVQLAADPTAPKDCPPFEPADSNDGLTAEMPSQPSIPWLQQGGTINHASCLNRTSIHGIVDVQSEDDLRQALLYARAHGLKVSTSGVRHRMGGHAFAAGALVLEMRRFNRIAVDDDARTVTVHSGATWHDIQNVLHPRFAVTDMQSTDIFTVGGSISVNAHGMDHHAGSMGRTVRSIRVMIPPLGEVSHVKLRRLVFNLSKLGPVWMRL